LDHDTYPAVDLPGKCRAVVRVNGVLPIAGCAEFASAFGVVDAGNVAQVVASFDDENRVASGAELQSWSVVGRHPRLIQHKRALLATVIPERPPPAHATMSTVVKDDERD